ncbi:GNAT family N-acetyltransferase [Hyphococcus flavus]|uniref:GNAT family N-acetyltransferase n=1 Tax=Hyphococcus flavus TaxID=1866326 RepID=A0AAF0CFR3_9PROT|nr:GNAT family N-acetyltransferase [Hyphococcus flavus]WDI32711.1 GNAT family N-acetyltransferase [Hyphococcus flavus]
MSHIAATSEKASEIRAELLSADVNQFDERLLSAWRRLAGDLAEENPFYESWALVPALQSYADKKVRLACIWSGDELLALLPVRASRGYARLPVAHWKSWIYPHCYFTTPLVKRGAVAAALSSLMALLCDGDEARDFLSLSRIDCEGNLLKTAEKTVQMAGRSMYETHRIGRAILRSGASAEATLAVHVRKKKRKELKRLRNRLEELGHVHVREYSGNDNLDQWIEAFLALEDNGWKRKRRTSLKAHEADEYWFREAISAASIAGKLHFIRIDLDDRPIAMLVSLIANGAGYSLKICHDPDFARYSPGVMIEIEAMRSLLERDDFLFMDSCASPDHSMINGLWRARRDLTTLNISGSGLRRRTITGLCRRLEGVRAKVSKGRK